MRGTVQGVGFRPFVHRLASSLELSGQVGNDSRGVWCEVQGPTTVLDEFIVRLTTDAPPLAVIAGTTQTVVPLLEESGFSIAISQGSPEGIIAIPPDVATCEACLAEVSDPDNRRSGYAFTCCTDCGPRFTVVTGLPYDRQSTSMSEFVLCAACQAEYQDPQDRRFHAQATCCPDCGPTLQLSFLNDGVRPADASGDPLTDAVRALAAGAIVAVKGLGGYQLVCRADDAQTVQRLRDRKHRPDKPFALLVESVAEAREIVELDELAERALSGAEAPIVLAPSIPGERTAPPVAPGTGLLGVMLSSTPLHAALVEGVGVPLVCTSGNRSTEPIAIDDATARSVLSDIADAVLSHNRSIERRADDSVGQVVSERFQLVRRARGYAPRAVKLMSGGAPVLAVGAELKNTICLAIDDRASQSVHLGDLENPATMIAFEAAIADQLAMAGVTPTLLVHDQHPEYLSTKFALTQDIAPTLAVQHHHAHLVSCLVDNQHAGKAIGVTFDGLGWGPDGTAWGGEFLVGDADGYDRAAHLKPVTLPGGAAAIRNPWRMAVSHLRSALGEVPDLSSLAEHQTSVASVVALCASDTSMQTTSIGRLFDAVAALCGATEPVTYEGQAAIGLEHLARQFGASVSPYEWKVGEAERLVIDPTPLISEIVADLNRNVEVAAIARRFHLSVAELIVDVCSRLRERSGLSTVALTGGVFQNRLLVELTVPALRDAGFVELRHSQVPPNDGGISLGQVAIGRAYVRSH